MLGSAAAVAPAQAADFGGKVSSNQNEEEFGFRRPVVLNWSGIYVGAHLGGAWAYIDWSGPEISQFVEGGRISHEVEGWLAVTSASTHSSVGGLVASKCPSAGPMWRGRALSRSASALGRR